MAYQNAYVKTVIQVLHDGERGFADIGEHLKSLELKLYFVQEAQTRGSFARELEAEYGTTTGESQDIGGTASGTIHRIWGDLKGNLGGSDHTLMETAEQGEDAAKKAYEAALNDTSISGAMRSILTKQQSHIQVSHDKVKAFRDQVTK
jgi:uncharacterized protein (TIGR02284 family)